MINEQGRVQDLEKGIQGRKEASPFFWKGVSALQRDKNRPKIPQKDEIYWRKIRVLKTLQHPPAHTHSHD